MRNTNQNSKTSPPHPEPPSVGETEQQPLLRFVDISSASPPLRFAPALLRANPGGHRPAEGAWEVDAGAPPKRLLDPKSRSDASRRWYVAHAFLTARPDDAPAPLRTARVVPATRAEVVANRLADCLRARSIAARFSVDRPVALCRNAGLCEFAVHLHAAGTRGVLVEVQRLRGDGTSFIRDCRALLSAAEGKAAADDEVPPHLCLPVSRMDFVKTARLPPISPAEEAAAVAVTAGLLASRRSDARRLGMESLVLETDPRLTLKSAAVRAARRVLFPDDPGNVPFSVHNYLMSVLLFGNPEDPAPAFPVDSALADHYAHLRILGLLALANALLAAEDVLPDALAPHAEWYAAFLVPRLLGDLGTASVRPLEACYASRCLAALAASSAAVARTV